MADFLLIHGASHGAWCWSKLIPYLQAAGHTARAIDLPSHGDDPTPPETVSMDDYVAACTGALGHETILVGHSLGGLTITLAAARAPERVRSLVYLCAFVPPPGVAFAEIRRQAITPALAETLTIDRARGVSIPDPDKASAFFYHDCSPEDVAFASTHLSPQPISVTREVLDFTPPATDRHYIRCLDDRVIFPDYQDSISADWPAFRVHQIDCGHSPFFSDPARLAQILEGIANT